MHVINEKIKSLLPTTHKILSPHILKLLTPASDASDQFVAPFRISSTVQALSHDFAPFVDVDGTALSVGCTWLVVGTFVLVLSLFNTGGGGGGGGGIASEAILRFCNFVFKIM